MGKGLDIQGISMDGRATTYALKLHRHVLEGLARQMKTLNSNTIKHSIHLWGFWGSQSTVALAGGGGAGFCSKMQAFLEGF